LLEGQFTFDVIDREANLTPYRVVLLPDIIVVDQMLKAKLEVFVAGGGRVLLTGRSGIDPDAGFVLDVGAEWHGTSDMVGGDYLLPTPELQASFVNKLLFMYRPSERIKITDGKSLGEVFDPYLDRTARHFSGHPAGLILQALRAVPKKAASPI
jgi:beta-galactosidase GanA